MLKITRLLLIAVYGELPGAPLDPVHLAGYDMKSYNATYYGILRIYHTSIL